MSHQVLIADINGQILTELEPSIQLVSWRLNKVGQLRMILSKNDDKVTEDHLHFGNRVMVQFDNGLPTWGGIIDPPRNWRVGIVEVVAYSGEYILSQRTTDQGRYFNQTAVGNIFFSIINEANGVAETDIRLGDIWEGGSAHSPEYHFKDLLWICQQSIGKNLSGADFEVIPILDEAKGKIVFQANLYENKGITREGVAFLEGANIGRIRLSEQGPIVNEWNIAGESSNPGSDGTGWGDDRLISQGRDDESVALYGLRQASRIYPDVSLQDTLDAHADQAINDTKAPKNLLDFVAFDQDPAKFEDYDIGDTLIFQAHTYGFGGITTSVRVLGREFIPSAGSCNMVVQEE